MNEEQARRMRSLAEEYAEAYADDLWSGRLSPVDAALAKKEYKTARKDMDAFINRMEDRHAMLMEAIKTAHTALFMADREAGIKAARKALGEAVVGLK